MTRWKPSAVSVAAPSVIRPAFLWTPPSAVGDMGGEVAELAIQLGQQVDEEERIALGALTPVQANGMPAGLESGIVCGRRQVKSWALEMATIHDAFVTKVHRVVWTAHLTETSDDNFEHLVALVESYDWLRKRVRRIYRGNGDHRIMLNDGGRVEFSARESGKTGRGRDVNRLILDEWLFGTAGTLGAMVPMLGAVDDRYIRYASSPGLLKSEALRQLRARGRRGGDVSLSWCEWTSERMVDGRRVVPECADADCDHVAGEAVGCFLDDDEIRRGVNPAYGRRLSPEFVDQERLAMGPEEYMRERCGVWEDPPTAEKEARDTVLADWPACADPSCAPVGAVALGVVLAHDKHGPAASIVACGAGADGRPTFEVVDYQSGPTTWVLPRLEELRQRNTVTGVGVVAGSPAAALPGLPADVTILSGPEYAGGCQSLAQDVAAGMVRHRDEKSLRISVDRAVRRFAGDGWRWSLRESRTDVSPLVAAVVARWLWTSTEPYDPLDNIG